MLALESRQARTRSRERTMMLEGYGVVRVSRECREVVQWFGYETVRR